MTTHGSTPPSLLVSPSLLSLLVSVQPVMPRADRRAVPDDTHLSRVVSYSDRQNSRERRRDLGRKR